MTSDDSALPLGAYETPITRRVQERITATREESETTAFGTVSGDDKSARDRYIQAVSRTLAERLAIKLDEAKKPTDRIALINNIASLLDEDEMITDEELLYAVYETNLADPPPLPEIPLSSSALLTNAAKDQNMSSEIRREIRTADSVDLLCAFIKNSGISVLHDELMDLKNRGIKLRVITSTYCGATDAKAVERLVRQYGAEVRIGYESKNTRLHAKAWLFKRESGFDTAYIGSSNLSNSALIDGIEWNVRTSIAANPSVVEKFRATFETYWNDAHFVPFTPETDLDRLRQALDKASGTYDDVIELSGLRVEPYPYQQAMLEALTAERVSQDRHRNLIVAATGTGKTVVAALDFRNLKEEYSRLPNLLFIAHRKEILTQALRTYREVLQLPDFGELLVDGQSPTEWKHVFASVQSLNSERLQAVPKDHFEVVVIDEFHHAEAVTYQRILDHFEPRELLGLTATPERADGINVQKFFDYRVAFELRLWEAMRLQLLAPMHYFGVNDDTDLTQLKWSTRAKDYDLRDLGDFYIKLGDRRVRLILSEIEKRVFDLAGMKALGFCVSIDHAEYMADRFNHFGVPARAVSSRNTSQERRKAVQDLRAGKVKVLFSVDIFNEGVDIPDVNTLLLLRPTQSPTVFLQQLGRGLRLAPGKDVCTVFDFIGQQREEFDFESRYYALTGLRGKRLEAAINEGFPHLPPGTNIILDRVSQERVLQNVKRFTENSVNKIKLLMSDEKTTDLSRFIEHTGIPIEDIYRRRKTSWTTLLREVDLLPAPVSGSSTEDFLLGRLRTMVHINDQERAQHYLVLSDPYGPTYEELDEKQRTYARMLAMSFWANPGGADVPDSFGEALNVIRRYPTITKEIAEITRYSVSTSRRIPSSLPENIGHGALHTHADYSRAELVGALRDIELPRNVYLPREGVHFFAELNLDLFLVTLVKDGKNFSATTSYKDYPISPDIFHWESQSSTALGTPTADRYIHHQERDSSIVMAVRNTDTNAIGLAQAFTLLGQVDYIRHQNEKPIQFEWKLQRPMPTQLYTQGRAVS